MVIFPAFTSDDTLSTSCGNGKFLWKRTSSGGFTVAVLYRSNDPIGRMPSLVGLP